MGIGGILTIGGRFGIGEIVGEEELGGVDGG